MKSIANVESESLSTTNAPGFEHYGYNERRYQAGSISSIHAGQSLPYKGSIQSSLPVTGTLIWYNRRSGRKKAIVK